MRVLVKKILAALWNERRKMFSFVIIGFSCVILTAALYGFLSRNLWPNGPRTFQYAMVIVLMTFMNYEANRRFTFNKLKNNIRVMGRFAAISIIATGLYTIMFWIGHEIFRIWDFFVIPVNQVLVGFFTFGSHRLFTFHPDPWRYFRQLKIKRLLTVD